MQVAKSCSMFMEDRMMGGRGMSVQGVVSRAFREYSPPAPFASQRVSTWEVKSPADVEAIIAEADEVEVICALADLHATATLEALVRAGFCMAPSGQVTNPSAVGKFIRPAGGAELDEFLPPLPERGIDCGELVLTHPRLSDIPALLEADWEASTREHALFAPLTEDAARAMVADGYFGWRRGPATFLVARTTSRGEPVAKLSMRRLVPPGVLDAGYLTFPGHRRMGIGWRSLAALTAWLFSNTSTHRIELGIKPENRASVRTAERAGYRFEARRPQRLKNFDGSYEDELSYAAVKNTEG